MNLCPSAQLCVIANLPHRRTGIVCYEDSFIYKNRMVSYRMSTPVQDCASDSGGRCFQLCIVMVLCEGGDLASVIEKRRMRLFTESEVCCCGAQ